MLSQWQCIKQNLGTWHGAFLQFSPTGELVKETPSVLTLTETEPDKTMALTLERTPEDGSKKVDRLTFTAPGPAPYTYFFESGAFSQGSPQWSSFGQFVTEFSLKVNDSAANERRVRFVVMYEATNNYTSRLKFVTLICETPTAEDEFVESATQLEQLCGGWQGTGQVLQAMTGNFVEGKGEWQIEKITEESSQLICKEQLGDEEHSVALKVDRTTPSTTSKASDTSAQCVPLQPTTENTLSYQLMLLPKGAYCLLPTEIKKETPFRIEVGWMSKAGERSRFIRYYDQRGVWLTSALINDKQVQ